MKVKTKLLGSQRVIDIDGETLYPSAYMSYHYEQENIDRMKKIGVKLFMFPIYFGDEGINMESGLRPFYDKFFLGYGEYNFALVDEFLSMIAPEGEEGIYIIPRVCLEPPKWWQEMYPDEVSRDYRGEPQRECYTSQKWREDMTVALRALIDHMESSPWKNNVIGYHIAAGGTEEWGYQARYANQFYDYSKPNLRAYRAFLKERYSALDSLSEHWGEKFSSWDEVGFPRPIERVYAQKGFLRHPDKERAVLDYYDFHSASVADTITYFCRQVKEYTNGDRLTGAFCGYVFAVPVSRKGLHAQSRVLASPDIDFISTTNWGAAWSFSCAVHSALMNGKMWIAEGDIRTCLTRGMQEKIPEAMPDNDYYSSRAWIVSEDMDFSCRKFVRALSRVLTAPCGIWWFDMWGGWFADERIERMIAMAEPLMAGWVEDGLKTEVAVIIDEQGYKYSAVAESTIRAANRELMDNLDRMGTPYHTYLASDLLKDDFPTDSYKMYVFVAAVNPEKEIAKAIERKLKCGQRTLVWLHSSGAYCESLSECAQVSHDESYTQKATYLGETYPHEMLPIQTIADDDGYVLSRLENGEAAVVWKQRKDYSMVYSVHLAPPSRLLQQIALFSGIHLYNITNDIVYAGGEYIGLLAMQDGYRRLNLPARGYRAENALTGESIRVNDMFIDIKMNAGDNVLIRLRK